MPLTKTALLGQAYITPEAGLEVRGRRGSIGLGMAAWPASEDQKPIERRVADGLRHGNVRQPG
jgi:hypothetical protein